MLDKSVIGNGMKWSEAISSSTDCLPVGRQALVVPPSQRRTNRFFGGVSTIELNLGTRLNTIYK